MNKSAQKLRSKFLKSTIKLKWKQLLSDNLRSSTVFNFQRLKICVNPRELDSGDSRGLDYGPGFSNTNFLLMKKFIRQKNSVFTNSKT